MDQQCHTPPRKVVEEGKAVCIVEQILALNTPNMYNMMIVLQCALQGGFAYHQIEHLAL